MGLSVLRLCLRMTVLFRLNSWHLGLVRCGGGTVDFFIFFNFTACPLIYQNSPLCAFTNQRWVSLPFSKTYSLTAWTGNSYSLLGESSDEGKRSEPLLK